MTARVLAIGDLALPAAPELPDGVVSLRDVWMHPGVNGMHDSEGRPILDTFLTRGPTRSHVPHGPAVQIVPVDAADASRCETIDRVVYAYVADAMMSHFGHLLTECAAHLGPLLDHPRGVDGLGGVGSHLVVPARGGPRCGQLSELLGIPASRVVTSASIQAPIRIRHAIVPRPSMVNGFGIASRHFRYAQLLLSRMYGVGDSISGLGPGDTGEALYLSRSRLPPAYRHAEGEEELEEALGARGWRISHPEQLTIDQQLESLLRARTIAGCLGSAMHLLMAFGERVGRRRLIALGPSPGHSTPNIALQASRQGLPYRHIHCLEDVPGRPGQLRFRVQPAGIAALVDELAAAPEWI